MSPQSERSAPLVEHFGQAELPTRWGTFDLHAYRNSGGDEHVAVVLGNVDSPPAPLVRVHSECLTGDVLGSLRCDCGPQLQRALEMVAAEGRGVVVYLRGHEGRGVGIGHKIRAYALQEHGLDTLEANAAQGLPVDARSYDTAAAVLADQGVSEVRLLTNNPAKAVALAACGIAVAQLVPLEVGAGPHNERYLHTKRTRLGHRLTGSTAS